MSQKDALSPCAGDRFSACAGNRFSACAGDQFSACAGDRFSACAGDQFSACAGDLFGACASDQFCACASDQFGTCAGDQFCACAGDQFCACASDQFGACAVDQLTACAAQCPLCPEFQTWLIYKAKKIDLQLLLLNYIIFRVKISTSRVQCQNSNISVQKHVIFHPGRLSIPFFIKISNAGAPSLYVVQKLPKTGNRYRTLSVHAAAQTPVVSNEVLHSVAALLNRPHHLIPSPLNCISPI